MFYLIKKNPWSFEWRWKECEGAPTLGAHHPLGFPPPLINRGWDLSLSYTHLLLSPSSHCSTTWSSAWRSHDRLVSPAHHTVVLLEFSGGSSTSAAPLDRGNGGRHQVVRVTEYGGVARLQRSSSRSWDRQVYDYIIHEIWSRNAFGLRGWVLLELCFRLYPLLTSTRLDIGVLVVLTIGNFLFSMLRTHQVTILKCPIVVRATPHWWRHEGDYGVPLTAIRGSLCDSAPLQRRRSFHWEVNFRINHRLQVPRYFYIRVSYLCYFLCDSHRVWSYISCYHIVAYLVLHKFLVHVGKPGIV